MLINWMIGVEAIVAVNEDPEHQHRIKVVIPILDEQKIYDKWVRPLGVPVLGQGYGGFYVPPKDSEVILFGRLGQKHNLFYLPSFNEDYEVSMDFRNEDGSPRSDDVCGVRAPGDLKHIAEGDYQLRAGRVFIETDGSVRIIAPGGIFMNGKRVA
jgi:hypothetical protein